MTNAYQATGGPADHCVFCHEPVPAEGAEAEIVLMSDYVDTPLGEETPGRRIGLCYDHVELLTERVPKSEELVVR